MTFIAEGGARTVTNCSVHGRRKVYEITCSVMLDVYAPHPGGEMEKTGQTVTETIVYHFIATSESLARVLFNDRWSGGFSRHTLVDVRVLFCIDEEISTGHN